jgi:hypothetical protein
MQTDLSNASTTKILPDRRGDAPLRLADMTAGKLVLRKRAAGGAVLYNKQRVNIASTSTPRPVRAATRR